MLAAQAYLQRHNAGLRKARCIASALWNYSELRPTTRALQSLIDESANMPDRRDVGAFYGQDEPAAEYKRLAKRWDEEGNRRSRPRRTGPRLRVVKPPHVGGDESRRPVLTEPVCVADAAKNLPRARGGGRSDHFANKLRRRGAPMAKIAGKWYVERENLLRLFPALRKWDAEHADAQPRLDDPRHAPCSPAAPPHSARVVTETP